MSEKKDTKAIASVLDQLNQAKDKLSATVNEYKNAYVVKHYEKGKDILEAQYQKTSKTTNDLFEKAKKYITDIPAVEAAQEQFNKTLNLIPSLLNMPNKNDLEKLSEDIKALDKKFDRLATKLKTA